MKLPKLKDVVITATDLLFPNWLRGVEIEVPITEIPAKRLTFEDPDMVEAPPDHHVGRILDPGWAYIQHSSGLYIERVAHRCNAQSEFTAEADAEKGVYRCPGCGAEIGFDALPYG